MTNAIGRNKGLLIILDGWGYRRETEHNAIALANTPTFNKLISEYPNTLIEASGSYVGLLDRTPGNSEVGHLTIGAGRVLDYESTRVHKAVKANTFQNLPNVQNLLKQAKEKGRFHLIGLLTDGNVHAHYEHFIPFLHLAKTHDIPEVYIHLFTDGRDSAQGQASAFIKDLERLTNKLGVGQIVTLIGRSYAMDRNGDLDKTNKVFQLLVHGHGNVFDTVQACLHAAYENNIKDEDLAPSVIRRRTGTQLPGLIQQEDILVAINFRGDRMKQLLTYLHNKLPKLMIYSMTDYQLAGVSPLFEQQFITNGLSSILAKYQINNMRIAESEKFPHVTFFINGKEKRHDPYQQHVHIPSPAVQDYALTPEMSIKEVTVEVIKAILGQKHELIITNLVNADLLGHTGSLESVIKAVEAVDQSLQYILHAAQKTGHWVMICGDHGNAEVMWDDALNTPHVGHTTNPVPFILIHPVQRFKLINCGTIASIAPTILQLLSLPVPPEMTAKSLIIGSEKHEYPT